MGGTRECDTHYTVGMPLNRSEPLVDFQSVAKQFPGGTQALANFSCSIAPGEFVSLLGPSGCGKSTALRLAAGLIQPTAGEVARPEQTPQCRSPVGCVFQSPTLMPWSKVWNNVYLPLRLAGISRSEAAPRVDDAIERVGLAEFVAAYPRQLSGGMQMRVSVARAMVTRPQLLLLDEPFAALDEMTRFRLNDDLLTLWQELGWAALFVTHSVYESVYLSSRVLVMSSRPGKVIADIPVNLPRPRRSETRALPEYTRLCTEVSQALRKSTEGKATDAAPVVGADRA